MSCLVTVFLCFGLIIVGMTATTEEGYCETPEGRVEVGHNFYSEFPCEKTTCDGHNRFSSVGCPEFHAPECETVQGTGNWPACCPRPVCPSDES